MPTALRGPNGSQANVKVAADGTVKLLDFGLAKGLESVSVHTDISSSPTLTRRATQAGMILGTAAYLSPEQAKGESHDRRSDIWAFGCVLFEMLVGKMAFSGESVTDTVESAFSLFKRGIVGSWHRVIPLQSSQDSYALPRYVATHGRLRVCPSLRSNGLIALGFHQGHLSEQPFSMRSVSGPRGSGYDALISVQIRSRKR